MSSTKRSRHRAPYQAVDRFRVREAIGGPCAQPFIDTRIDRTIQRQLLAHERDRRLLQVFQRDNLVRRLPLRPTWIHLPFLSKRHRSVDLRLSLLDQRRRLEQQVVLSSEHRSLVRERP